MGTAEWKTYELDKLFRYYRKGVDVVQIALAFNRPVEDVRLKLEQLLALQASRRSQGAAEKKVMPRPTASIYVADTDQGDEECLAINGAPTTPELTDTHLAFARFHFVYAIVNGAGNVYIGYSQTVWHRISQHNLDLGATATREQGPWFPFAVMCFASEREAREAEVDLRREFSFFIQRTRLSLRTVLAQLGLSGRIRSVTLV